MRGAADRRKQIVRERQVDHLVARNVENYALPALDRISLVVVKLRLAALQAVGRKEVAGHEAVLDLGGLRKEIDELIAVFDDDLGLGRPRVPSVNHRSPLRSPLLLLTESHFCRSPAARRICLVPVSDVRDMLAVAPERSATEVGEVFCEPLPEDEIAAWER